MPNSSFRGRFDNVAVKALVLGCRILRPPSKLDFISDAYDGCHYGSNASKHMPSLGVPRGPAFFALDKIGTVI